MHTTRPPFRKPLKTGFEAFYKALPQIAAFEILYRAATALVVKPVLGFLLQLLLQISGEQLAFNDGIWEFFLTIPGIIAIVVLAAVATLLIHFEFSVVITLARQGIEGDEISLKSAVAEAIWAFGTLKSPGTLLFSLYALGLLPIINMGITSSLLPRLAVPNFILGELTKTSAGEWSLLAGFVVIFLVFFGLLFTLPAMVLEHKTFVASVKRSFGAIKAYGPKIFGILLVFVLAWVVLFQLPRFVFDFFFGATSVSFVQAVSHFGFSFRTPMLLLVWLLATTAQISLMPMLLTLLTACYLPVGQPVQPSAEAVAKISDRLRIFSGKAALLWAKVRGFARTLYKRLMQNRFIRKHKRLLAIVLIALLAWTVYYSFFVTVGIGSPVVIGHRGSAFGVENTLEAIQNAIDVGADYAEVDILLSKDGVPMVIHDTNLGRLAGQDINVYDLTAEELAQITLSQNGYTGHISTLEEVVAYCEGKIKLAVEYKLHGHEEEDIVRQVMQVIGQSTTQKDSIFLSLDYSLVSQMKEQYASYTTGYCVYGNVGQLTASSIRSMNIDFLLVEEWMVSPELMRACGRAWVPVYVWTVNDSEAMEDYLHMGVTGLVTDYPGAAKEVMDGMFDLTDVRIVTE